MKFRPKSKLRVGANSPSSWGNDFLSMLFPKGIPTNAPPKIHSVAVGGQITTGYVRECLASVDRQDAPSPFLVRFGQDDLSVVEYEGLKIAIDKADISVSSSVCDGNRYEPHVAEVMKSTLRPGHHFLDIGANLGIHSLFAARLVGPNGRVTAVEPNSENCRLLLHSVQLNDLSNVELLPVALSDHRGWSYFSTHIGSNGGFISGRPDLISDWGVVVPTFTLDSLALGQVDLVKVDVEGAEYLVAQGGYQTISTYRPTIISEFSCEMIPRVSTCSTLQYLEFFTSIGYRISIIDRETCDLIQVDSAQALLNSWGPDLGRIEDLLFTAD